MANLLSDGLMEYLFVMLTRFRLDKCVSDKILQLILMLSRAYKPLERSNIEFLWKILSIHAEEEFYREQFFVFLK